MEDYFTTFVQEDLYPTELAGLTDAEIDSLIAKLNINYGSRLRFKKEIDKLRGAILSFLSNF